VEIALQPRLSQFVVEVSDPSHAGQARRSVVEYAQAIGLGENDSGAVAIAVTELATNVVKHARNGKIIYEQIAQNGCKGLRILSIDKGPGIRNITTALEDGYSTSGTSGNGLGAVRRLASFFDIYSLPDQGTCVLAEFWPDKKIPKTSIPLQLGVMSVPLRGEEVSGDGWAIRTTSDHVYLMVVDGLGHGTFASEAAREAEFVLAQTDSKTPSAILGDCHDALKKTRGAAAAIVAIAKEKNTLSFAGLGNISAALISPEGRRGLASHNGTLGHQMHKIQEFTVPWKENSTLIMHSDGLISRWDLETYPGIVSKHSSIVAAVLHRDFDRERDDVTVLVAKNIG
jgi:anti-sigma regulatory factor (Ser/Thr protein kinase)